VWLEGHVRTTNAERSVASRASLEAWLDAHAHGTGPFRALACFARIVLLEIMPSEAGAERSFRSAKLNAPPDRMSMKPALLGPRVVA
jgi:hypothetical protein